jgi:AraC-like DNA-binding protein
MHVTPGTGRADLPYIGTWSAARGQHAPPHRHAGWKVTYYRTGRIDSLIDGVRHSVGPGDVLVLPPHALHEEIAHTAYSDYYLVVDGPADRPWPARCHGEAAHDVGWLLARILREVSTLDADGPPMTPALLDLLDATLRRANPLDHPSPGQRIVRAVEQLFEEDYASGITVASAARQVGASTSSLRHHFSVQRGISPQEALHQVRLRHALTLLRSSDLTLGAIAERCGFDSASHLSRRVKAATGSSPGRLR